MRRASLLVVLVLIVSLVLPGVASAHSGGFWLVVQPGQTVYSIGRWYGVSPYAIAAANGLANWNIIYAGQPLWIPAGGGPYGYYPGGSYGYYPGGWPYGYSYPGCARNHYVSPGETLFGISRWYGVSAWAIASASRVYNLNTIYAGQWLCIPG